MSSVRPRILLLVTWLLLLLTLGTAFAEKTKHPLLEQLAAADSVQKVEAIAVKIDAFVSRHPDQKLSGEMLWRLSHAWYALDRRDVALQTLERLEKGWHVRYGGLALVGMAEIHSERGDERKAEECLERALEAPSVNTFTDIMDADNTMNRACRGLGAILERHGDWARALSYYEAWKPTSWCGNEAEEYANDRTMRIAWCHFHLGKTDQALDELWGILTQEHNLNGFYPEAAIMYGEVAARSGKLDDAAKRMATLPDANRKRYLTSLRLAEGFAKKDPDAMLKALEGLDVTRVSPDLHYGPPELFAASRLLTELGPVAIDCLSDRIADGNIWAIVLTSDSNRKEYLPLLKRRLEIATDSVEKTRLQEAIDHLDKLPNASSNAGRSAVGI